MMYNCKSLVQKRVMNAKEGSALRPISPSNINLDLEARMWVAWSISWDVGEKF